GCRRDALPAGPPGAGDHGRGDGWSSFHRVRSGRKPAPCPEGDPRPLPGGRLRAPRQPVNRVLPLRATVGGLRRWLRYVAGVLVLTGAVAAIVFPQAALNALQLPLLAVFSTTRMVVAYVFSLLFAITYGHTAATNKRAAVVLLPVLDVLQSIPILGFFPAALGFFVATFHGHPIGIELAVVFLTFTRMS